MNGLQGNRPAKADGLCDRFVCAFKIAISDSAVNSETILRTSLDAVETDTPSRALLLSA